MIGGRVGLAVRARTGAPRGRGVGRWAPTSARVGFGAKPRLTSMTASQSLYAVYVGAQGAGIA